MRPTQKASLVILAGMHIAPIAVMMTWASRSQSLRSVLAIALAGILFTCLVAAATRTWPWFFRAQFPLSLLAGAFLLYTLLFHMPPGHTLALLLLGASPEEIRGFLGLPMGRLVLAVLVAWSAAYLTLTAMVPDAPIFAGPARRIGRVLVTLCIALTAYAAGDAQQLIDGVALNPAVGSLMFLGGTLPRANRERHGELVQKVPYHAHRSGAEEVHVLVVGESARRASWSAYGYARPTTPYLDALAGGAILLRNAYADANLTEWAVPILLTGISPREYSESRVHGSIFDLAAEAGYSTAWLVNQDLGISLVTGVNPDRLVYPPDFSADINGRHTLDGLLLPAYRQEIHRAGSPRFIGIHMMGSHWEYYRRYPAEFQHFGSPQGVDGLTTLSVFLDNERSNAAVVDAYDNSVLYTDWFLHEVIAAAAQLDVPATVTFYPDHGESLQMLDGVAGHGEPTWSRHAYEVPAFVWVNAAYQLVHPGVVAALRTNAGKLIRSHDVLYTVAGMMGIQWPGADGRRSFASAQFEPDTSTRYVAGGRMVAPD